MDTLSSALPLLKGVGVRAQDIERLPLLQTLKWKDWEIPQRPMLDDNIAPKLVCDIWNECICHADVRPQNIGQVAEKHRCVVGNHPVTLVVK